MHINYSLRDFSCTIHVSKSIVNDYWNTNVNLLKLLSKSGDLEYNVTSFFGNQTIWYLNSRSVCDKLPAEQEIN